MITKRTPKGNVMVNIILDSLNAVQILVAIWKAPLFVRECAITYILIKQIHDERKEKPPL